MTESAHAPSPFQRILQVGNQRYRYYALPAAYAELGDLSRLPFALKIVLENLLRHEDGKQVTRAQIKESHHEHERNLPKETTGTIERVERRDRQAQGTS